MTVLKAASAEAVSLSVGIIGGADGPTAVFVTSPPWTAVAVSLLALAAGVLIYVLLRRKR